MPGLVIAALVLAALGAAPAAAAEPAPSARAAAVRAMPLLQKSAQTFVEKRACVSCHHNILPILTLRMARERGLIVDAAALGAVEDRTFRELHVATAIDDAVQGSNVSDPTPNDTFLLMAAHAAGLPRSLATEIYARRIARWQRGDHWETSDFRPPHSGSHITATATAVRAVRLFMPPESRTEGDAAIERARGWLAAVQPRDTEDAAFRLLGLVWADAPEDARAAARRDLIERQRADGGWAQLPHYRADAYSTGEALVALREAGVPINDAAVRRGMRFLISTQAPDGTWRVRTRMLSPAEISPPYFHPDFPYGKDSFLSYAGTCWAVMALLSAEDPLPLRTQPQATVSPAVVSTAAAPSWMRLSLFGSASELQALLNAGLDPNSTTDSGTTPLMAAAADAEKVRLLLLRGAKATQRAREGAGVDALTVASTYRGTAASIRALLDAGASAVPPRDVRLRHAPLGYVSMAGDRDSAVLLLSAGAKPTADALSESITFGNPAITRLLLDAGADAAITEPSGVTLLHWAVIANRPSAIPLLVSAGVPIDAKDSMGYTPLMYAATVDVGDTALIDTLLAAGASVRVRNAAGRTPLEQAQFLAHRRLAAALSQAAAPKATSQPRAR